MEPMTAVDLERALAEATDRLRATATRSEELLTRLLTWRLRIGPLLLERSVSSGTIAKAFAAWHLVLLGVGVVFTTAWANLRELGIALVVGALFGFGAFIAQVWSMGMTREHDFIRRVFNEDEITELRQVAAELNKIYAERQQLSEQLERVRPASRQDL